MSSGRLRFRGKMAFVTGGGTGIGKATATGLLAGLVDKRRVGLVL